jgi:ABC-type transport system substrate-binding protein
MDTPLSPTEITTCLAPPYNTQITLDRIREIGMSQFDINNNDTMMSYPNIKSPTSDVNFRQAIAYMVDKPTMISTYLSTYAIQLESPLMPWLRWYDPTMVTHPYNPATACQILYNNGWRGSPSPPSLSDVIVTKDRSTLTWSSGATTVGWHGWWFRHGTQWFQFDFTNLDTMKSTIDVLLNLPVANHDNGEFGLDGLVDVVINPGSSPTTTYSNVLLDNVDPNNLVYAHMDPGGSPRATVHLSISKDYVVGGHIAIQVLRHTDSNLAPTAPIGTKQPIIMTDPPTVPSGVYENGDANTVHLFVYTEEGDGGSTVTSANGEGFVSLTYTTTVVQNSFNVHFPATWPQLSGGPNVAGLNLKDVLINGPHTVSDPGLIFYRRSDLIDLNGAARDLIWGTGTAFGLEGIGIPVDDNSVPLSSCLPHVLYNKDFHLYTGRWILGRDPDYLYDMWSGDSMNWDVSEFSLNYDNINDPLWNSAVRNIKYASTLEAAQVASHAACAAFSLDVPFIPLWTVDGYLAHKNNWHALNMEGYGVRHWWNLYCTNNPSVGITGGTLRVGLSHDIESLNPIYPDPFSMYQYAGPIYNWWEDNKYTKSCCPLNIGIDMPWTVNGWTIGTWTNPNTGMSASKISFTLRTDIKWINPITGTIAGSVTPEDVRFSTQYIYDHSGWDYPKVQDLFVNPDGSLKIEIAGNTITFYESVYSIWAANWLGETPILPKYVFETTADPHGFYAGGLPPETAMVGCGAFYFVSYTPGVSMLFEANRNYFKTIVPNTDTDPVRIKLDWGIFKSNVKSGDWTVNVLDLIIVAQALGWNGPPGDIPQDINKDGHVNVLDLIIVATNIGASW